MASALAIPAVSDRGGITLKTRSVEVLGMFWQHLETHEIGVLVSDCFTVDEDVLLFVHQLSERVLGEGAAHAHEQLRVLQVRVELVECLWLGAV